MREGEKFIGWLRSAETEPKYFGRIDDGRVLSSESSTPYLSQKFEPQGSYISLRLTRMFLRNRREYSRQFAPFAIVALSVLYDDERKRFPFYIGNDVFKDVHESIGEEMIEFRDMPILSPFPYVGDDVGLFVALFRTVTHDYARSFFSLIDDLSRAFDPTQLSKYVQISDIVAKGLSGMLGLADVEARLGASQNFVGPKLRSGFHVFMNASHQRVRPQRLWLLDGDLMSGPEGGSAVPDRRDLRLFRDADFCLLEVGHAMARSDYVTLPFHHDWKRCLKLVLDGEAEKARLAFMDVIRGIKTSSDLTKPHRAQLLISYRADFAAETADVGTGGTDGTREPSGNFQTACMQMQIAGMNAKKHGYGDIAPILGRVADAWERGNWPYSRVSDERDVAEEISGRLAWISQHVADAAGADPDRIAETFELDLLAR